MGWETRNGCEYYYIKQRIGGRVVSSYVGAGPLSELVEARVQKRAEARATEQVARRAEEALDAEIAEASKLIAELVKAALLATNHHQHKGEWRLRANG